MANSSLHHPLLMALTIIINLCLISTAQSPPAPPSTTIPPPPPSVPSLPTIMAPSPAPSLRTTTIQPPSAVPSLPTTMAPPPAPSLPTITIQPPPPVPSLPITMAPPPPPPPAVRSLPTITIQPPPPVPSLPTNMAPPPPLPVPSLPTTIIPPPPPLPVPSLPTTIIPPPPPLPSLPTTASPPSPPPTTTSTPPSPPPSTIIPSTSPASSPTTALTSPPNTTSSPPPPPPTTTSPPPPPPPPLEESDPQDEQFDNIIDALLSAGDFGAWAGILSAADLSGFPLVATLFIPGNDALSHFPTATSSTLNFDPFIIPYHIIPQRLSFSDLQQFKSHTRLPTLLPSKTILITDNSPSNFSINDSPITHPDLYATTSVSVHGIKTILDYSLYGGNELYLPDETMPRPTPAQETAQPFLPTGEIMGRRRSDAACLCTEFPIVLSVVCAALAFKIHRNPLTR